MAPSQNTNGSGITRRKSLAALAGVGTLAVAGCSDDDGANLTIEASGSNTVRPLTDAVGEAFEDSRDDDVRVNVRGPGTGAGFEEFTQGDTDIQNASRDISEGEQTRADENGIDFTRFTVGQDGLTVYLHPENDWVDYITADELQQIYDFESDVETWSDVRSEWPDEDIDVWSRDTDSGTFDFFTEVINGEPARVRQDDITMRQETIAIVDGVAQNQFAIGFGGWSYWQENQDRVNAAPVQDRGESEAFAPTVENINAGDYTPLTRPLFTFYNNDAFEREVIVDFARFYFDNVQDVALDVGFFGAPDATLDENHEKLDELL
ncbi:phosphate ABC transporter substrate-binding protein PstS family protein [Halorubrum tibetense]|uniref:Phosphate ABC transporter substrate-binding protein PstS family protein n=1 Tax=Halorubrum tibetense TaxID=175631 RepID=A0ABD5SBK1_9EURY